MAIGAWPGVLGDRGRALREEYERLKREYWNEKDDVANSDDESDGDEPRRERPAVFEDVWLKMELVGELNLLVQQLASRYEAFDPRGAAAESARLVEEYEAGVTRMLELSLRLEVVPPYPPRAGLRVRMYLEGAPGLGGLPASQLLELYDRIWEGVEANRAAALVTFDNQQEDLAYEEWSEEKEVRERQPLSPEMEYTFSQLALELDAIAKRMIQTGLGFAGARQEQLQAFSERVFTTWPPPTSAPEGAPWWNRVPRSYPWSGAGGHNDAAPPPRGIQLLPADADDAEVSSDFLDSDEDDLEAQAAVPVEQQAEAKVIKKGELTASEKRFKVRLESKLAKGENAYAWLYGKVTAWVRDQREDALAFFATRYPSDPAGAMQKDVQLLNELQQHYAQYLAQIGPVNDQIKARKLALSPELAELDEAAGELVRQYEELQRAQKEAKVAWTNSGREQAFKAEEVEYSAAKAAYTKSKEPLYAKWRAADNAEKARNKAATERDGAVGTPAAAAKQQEYAKKQAAFEKKLGEAGAVGPRPEPPNAPNLASFGAEGAAYAAAEAAFVAFETSQAGQRRKAYYDIIEAIEVPYKGKDGASTHWGGYPVQKEMDYRRIVRQSGDAPDWLAADGTEISIFDALTRTAVPRAGLQPQGAAIALSAGRPFELGKKVGKSKWVWGSDKSAARPGALFNAWPVADPAWRRSPETPVQGIDQELCRLWILKRELDKERERIVAKGSKASQWFKVGTLGREQRGGTKVGGVVEVKPAKPFSMKPKRGAVAIRIEVAAAANEEDERTREELKGVSDAFVEMGRVAAMRFWGEASRQRMKDIVDMLRFSASCVWTRQGYVYANTQGLDVFQYREISDPPARPANADDEDYFSDYALFGELDETSALSEAMDKYATNGLSDPSLLNEVTEFDPTSPNYGFRTYTPKELPPDADASFPALVLKPYAVIFDTSSGQLELDFLVLERFYPDVYGELKQSVTEWYDSFQAGRDAEGQEERERLLNARLADDNDIVYGKGDLSRAGNQKATFVGPDGESSITTRVRPRKLTEFPDDADKEAKWRAVVGNTREIWEWFDWDSKRWNPIVDKQPYQWNPVSGGWDPLPWDDRSSSFRYLGWLPADEDPDGDEYAEWSAGQGLVDSDDEYDFASVPSDDYAWKAAMDAEAVEVVVRENEVAVTRKLYPGAPWTADPRYCLSDGRWYGLRDPWSYEWIHHVGAVNAKRSQNPEASSRCDAMSLLTDRVLSDALATHRRPARNWARPQTVRLTTAEKFLLQWFNESQPYAAGAGGRTDLLNMVLDAREFRVRVDPASLAPAVAARREARKRRMSFTISRRRMAEIGMVCSVLPEKAALLQQLGNGLLVAGEPPPGPEQMTLYWVQPKDDGYYEFTDPDGRKNGGFIQYKHCFGMWDPLRGEWLYFPRRGVVPIEDRHAPIGEGYAFRETGEGKQLERYSSVYTPHPPERDHLYRGTGLTSGKLAELRAENLRDSVEANEAVNMLAESGWGSQHFGPATSQASPTYRPGYRFPAGTAPVDDEGLPIVRDPDLQTVVYYTPNLRHVELLVARELPADWTPVYIQGEDRIIPDTIPGAFDTGKYRDPSRPELGTWAPWAVWNSTNAVWLFPRDPANPNRLMTVSVIDEIDEVEGDEELMERAGAPGEAMQVAPTEARVPIAGERTLARRAQDEKVQMRRGLKSGRASPAR